MRCKAGQSLDGAWAKKAAAFRAAPASLNKEWAGEVIFDGGRRVAGASLSF